MYIIYIAGAADMIMVYYKIQNTKHLLSAAPRRAARAGARTREREKYDNIPTLFPALFMSHNI